MAATRYLVVTADDFGIGPATSRAILDVADLGLVTGTVLIVNSPYAADAVRAWKHAGRRLDMGWHPNLTIDAPLRPAHEVRSLVRPDGCFWPLGQFLRRATLGLIRASEVRGEFQAQYDYFCEVVGKRPVLVNSHQHCELFGPAGAALLDVLVQYRPLPYLRRIREPWHMLARIPGARLKRAILSLRGRKQARRQRHLSFPGNRWLAGITDPQCVADPQYLVRWLTRMPGDVVELACHPGYHDGTLIGRDCTANDGLLQRRVDELARLKADSFRAACRAAGFRLVAPSELTGHPRGSHGHAA